MPVDHLAGEVIGDVAVVAGEAFKERVRIVASTQRERRELQSRNPSFRALLQQRALRGREAQVHHVREEAGRLFSGEAQVGSAQLGQLVPRPQLCERERRISAAGEDEMDMLREARQQVLQRVVDGARGDDVVIVEDEVDWVV